MTLDEALELHRAGDLVAAADAYSRVLENEPGNHDAQYGLGTVRLQQGDPGAASQLLEQAVSVAPGVAEYHFNYGLALQRLEEHFAAAEQFDIATRLRPEGRAIWLALAQSRSRVRDYPAAIEAQERAFDCGPATAADTLAYADLLFMARRIDDARRAVKKARELGSNDAQGYFLEARCQHIAGDSDDERELLLKAVDIRPGYGDAWQYLLDLTPDDKVLALALDCEAIAGGATETARDSALLHYTSGRAYDRLGDYAQAAEQFTAGNLRQSKDAAARGKSYDKIANDRFVDWVRNEMDGRATQASSAPAQEQPVFIVGLPRSGTTLVECILGGLDGITLGGESEALDHVTARYYNALASGHSPNVRGLQPRHWDELTTLYWRIQTGKRCRLTDKMPTNFRHVGMMLSMFPNAPVIYLRRDPRDVALSIWSRYFPDGHAYATDFDDLAHYIAFSERLMAHWKKIAGERIQQIDYETLVTEPESTSRRLADFCGLDWQPNCLEIHKRSRASLTFSEMQVREPINTKGVGRWRNYEDVMGAFIEACDAYGVRLRDN